MSVLSRRFATVVVVLVAVSAMVSTRGAATSPSWMSGMPDTVVSMRDSQLDSAGYEELVHQWRQYRDKHPDSAMAEVQLGRALRYAGRDPSEVNAHFAQALKLDPDSPEALLAAADTYLGPGEALADDAPAAYDLGLRAVAAAPHWPEPHFVLHVLALRLGDLDAAEGHLVALLRKGGIPTPVLDYCYNMLVGAAPKAIIFTNGDNDTFGCLALQAAFELRPDVHVLNLSLLNLVEADEVFMDAFPAEAAPLSTEERTRLREEFLRNYVHDGEIYSVKVMKTIAARAAEGSWPDPVYLALTISPGPLNFCTAARRIEGILWRVIPAADKPSGEGEQGVDLARSQELFATDYRLDSATDLAFDWNRHNSIRHMMGNYEAVYFRMATTAAEAGETAFMREAFAAGLRMAEFHGKEETVARMAGYWLKLDPDHEEARRWAAGR